MNNLNKFEEKRKEIWNRNNIEKMIITVDRKIKICIFIVRSFIAF